MPGTIPTDTEWNQLTSNMAESLTRLHQAEAFNGEMDTRQADTEDTVTDHEARVKALESWRGSADATMNLAQKLGQDNGTAITALQTADTSIINRVKPLETWKPQVDATLAGHATVLTSLQSSVSQASARLDGMAVFQGKLSDAQVALSKSVTDLQKSLADYMTATNARLTKLEQPKSPEPPVAPST